MRRLPVPRTIRVRRMSNWILLTFWTCRKIRKMMIEVTMTRESRRRRSRAKSFSDYFFSKVVMKYKAFMLDVPSSPKVASIIETIGPIFLCRIWTPDSTEGSR
ncbi:hypothetical protein MPTK1_8g01850 [Marchantia polymorpha subsp. ruderalis]|uniref:Uncharacterized protein n=1 Tax=Marchantia polymorpha TaxID=3197 RepID=A0A2R6WR34_MARPO|nr:hypothetical protein MARPO_0064s0015 [Marchantia polymorpha]BBN18351.1 hypothetical protein Mp_8g01850 [Marchantia polymorpha subsp. ruderalis]|eukprot:PTQ36322.1 hypothetical protein MARPO_0064s0015 [Marchantia polymorpha]